MRRDVDAGWIARLPLAQASSAAGLRGESVIEVAVDAEWLWLRAASSDPAMMARLPLVPGLQRFRCLDEQRLVRLGRSVPELRVPDLSWQSILDFFPVALPHSGLPGLPPPPRPIELVRGGAEHPATALLLPFAEFAKWVETAPLARLRPSSFARCADGRGLVRGHPLPPLPGLALYFDAQLAIPCGYCCAPAVPARILARALGQSIRKDPDPEDPDPEDPDPEDTDGLYLLLGNSRWDWLPGDSFVATSRGAVRATQDRALRDGPAGDPDSR